MRRSNYFIEAGFALLLFTGCASRQITPETAASVTPTINRSYPTPESLVTPSLFPVKELPTQTPTPAALKSDEVITEYVGDGFRLSRTSSSQIKIDIRVTDEGLPDNISDLDDFLKNAWRLKNYPARLRNAVKFLTDEQKFEVYNQSELYQLDPRDLTTIDQFAHVNDSCMPFLVQA